jgi:regulator of replication initiation timing
MHNILEQNKLLYYENNRLRKALSLKKKHKKKGYKLNL